MTPLFEPSCGVIIDFADSNALLAWAMLVRLGKIKATPIERVLAKDMSHAIVYGITKNALRDRCVRITREFEYSGM